MIKRQYLFWVLPFILTFTVTVMSAQQNMTQPTLDEKQQKTVLISAFAANGNMDSLQQQLNAGLDAGLTVNEIKEMLVQLYAYCGFPRSLNAINLFKTVLDDRKSKGLAVITGKEASGKGKNKDKYEQGRKVLENLTRTPQSKPAPGFGEFAPRIDAFLKEHLFADIFDSDVLTYQQRELVTISALAAMPGVEPQLSAHVTMGKNTGIMEEQLIQAANLIENAVGRTQANTIRKNVSTSLLPVLQPDMMVRISEIEIVPEYLAQYNEILKEESAASVKKESGVIAIFPMFQKENPAQIRIIEMYANKAAYQAHLQTPHFQHYKSTTLKMVKSLKLIDMSAIDPKTMTDIFRKLK